MQVRGEDNEWTRDVEPDDEPEGEMYVDRAELAEPVKGAEPLFDVPYFAVKFKSFDPTAMDAAVQIFMSGEGMTDEEHEAFVATIKFIASQL